MPTTIAVTSGSFDPPTVGHVDIVQRGAALFDRLVVAVGDNPAKRTWFDAPERVRLVREAVGHLPNVEVVAFGGLIVDAARAWGATVILRGLRALSDFDVEFRYALANRDLSGIETLFLPSDPRHVFVSSSIVKEIAQNGGDVAPYLPAGALLAVRAKLAERGR